MNDYKKTSQYDKEPETKIIGYDNEAYAGYDAIAAAIKQKLGNGTCLVVDAYPGTDCEKIIAGLSSQISFQKIIRSEEIFYEEGTLNTMMQHNLTDDRVRGIMYYGKLEDFVDHDKCREIQKQISKDEMTLICGVGASLIQTGDVLVYADLARWEIQLRYRRGMPNFKCTNTAEDVLIKYKRGYFIEWRIADRHKEELYSKLDFYFDANQEDHPKMVTGKAFLAGLQQLTVQPFRLVPYFDPGVWGGHWMQEVCHLEPAGKNYAWSFDGVPEENSLYLKYGEIRIESPAMNLVKYRPKQFLGPKDYARFGAEYPIRFDFLDTIGGQKLSLQVHPVTEYIKEKFGMTYTQDESYYILDAEEGGGVYLGLKEGIDPQEMLKDLREAQTGAVKFDAEKYVNLFPAQKHDHFLIPAGTIHCSSSNCMILEISATPYIFTFKLWDWDRLGLDGKPRPIHIDDGEKVIQWDRTTSWVKDNLVNHFETVKETPAYSEIRTGLHELEFIETRVITMRAATKHCTHGEFNMLNLVDGAAAVIESPAGQFEPYTVHYAETFIIPAGVKEYTIRPAHSDQEIKVLKAYVRF